jgi:natural product precursor
MKKGKIVKKLKLNRETIRVLSRDDLQRVAGGGDTDGQRSILVQSACGGHPPEETR